MLSRTLLVFLIICSAKVNAEETYNPNEFTERILLFRTKAGDLLFDGLLAHQIDRTLYISAVDLFETLGFKTELSMDSKTFTANTVSPPMEVLFTWSKCSLKVNSRGETVNCAEIKIYEDELFLSSSLTGRILDAQFEYLPFKSEIRIDTSAAYPKLSALKRNSEKASIGPRRDFDPGYQKKKVESQTLKNFYIDQQLTWSKESQKNQLYQYYSNISTDILQHEVQVTSQIDNQSENFNTWLIKRDFYGPNKRNYISSYGLGNVVIPTAELIGGPEGGQGFYITNRDQLLINFSQREFEGNLRPDWEVELYVNDNLFDRQRADEVGRYRFQNVPVQYGENNFRLEFYGPLGERRTEYINNNVSAENLTSGQFRYEAGVVNDESSISGNSNIESLIQGAYGLTNNLSTYFAYTKHNIFNQENTKDFALIGLNGYLRNLNYSLFTGEDFSNNGQLYAFRSQFILNRSRLQFTYLDANKFKSNFIGNSAKFLDRGYKLNLSSSLFGRASVLYRAEHNVFEDLTEETLATQNLVLPIKRLTFLLQNNLVTGKDNKIDLIYTYLRNQFRSSMVYDWDNIKSYDIEYRNRFKKESSISLSYAKAVNLNTKFLRAGYQQRFNGYSLGLEASTDINKTHSVLARFRSSLGYNSFSKTFQMSADLLASTGNVCAQVYYDRNENGQLEKHIDVPVKDVSLRWLQGNIDFTSNSNGDVFLSNLPLYTPTDIQLLVKTLKEPQMVPIEKGFRVFLQKGQCTTVTFLLKKVYDFEGQIFIADNLPQKRLTVSLTDAYGKTLAETRTDKEGYFLFDEQPARAYYLKIKNSKYKITPDVYVINPLEPETLDQDFYFDVSK